MEVAFADCKPGIKCTQYDCGNFPPVLYDSDINSPEEGPMWNNLISYVIPNIGIRCGECSAKLPAEWWENGETEVTFSGEYNNTIHITSTLSFSPESCGEQLEWNQNYPGVTYACCTNEYSATITITISTDSETNCLGASYGFVMRYFIDVNFSDSCGNNLVCQVPWANVLC